MSVKMDVLQKKKIIPAATQYQCDECGAVFSMDDEPEYCPMCGEECEIEK